MDALWGPLAPLTGTWEGDEGLDVAYSYSQDALAETPFRERATFERFGPVDNGPQRLYGLDYRMAAWSPGDVDPFHMEIGYWIWDASSATVMRCFSVPRGVTLIAAATCEPDATTFTMQARLGAQTYGILSNPFLDDAARTLSYDCTITIGADEWSYDSTTVIDHAKFGKVLDHTDRNVLRRVAG